MRFFTVGAAVALGVSFSVAAAQIPTGTPGMGAEITVLYTAVKSAILTAANRMSAENYNFQPTPDLPSFAESLSNIAHRQVRACSSVVGDPQPRKTAPTGSKADVITDLEASFAECDKAYGSLSDANAGQTIVTVDGRRTKLGLLAENISQECEQYGSLLVYLRLKGIVLSPIAKRLNNQP